VAVAAARLRCPHYGGDLDNVVQHWCAAAALNRSRGARKARPVTAATVPSTVWYACWTQVPAALPLWLPHGREVRLSAYLICTDASRRTSCSAAVARSRAGP
jgi:hypothetical protein